MTIGTAILFSVMWLCVTVLIIVEKLSALALVAILIATILGYLIEIGQTDRMRRFLSVGSSN